MFTTRDRRNFGAVFVSSSVLVPFCMGAVAGAIASGRVPVGGKPAIRGTAGSTRRRSSVASSRSSRCAYLAAVYLTWDARRFDDAEMVEYFRRRAIGAAVVAGVVAFAGIFVLRADARYVFDGLTSRALPIVIISGLCGGSLVLLRADQLASPGCSRPARWPRS